MGKGELRENSEEMAAAWLQSRADTLVRYAWRSMAKDRGTALLVARLYRQPLLIRFERQCLAQPHRVAAHEVVPLL
jgi:hypothetical protein